MARLGFLMICFLMTRNLLVLVSCLSLAAAPLPPLLRLLLLFSLVFDGD
jgi:hypothetical protein